MTCVSVLKQPTCFYSVHDCTSEGKHVTALLDLEIDY